MTKIVVAKTWTNLVLGPDGRYYSNPDRATGPEAIVHGQAFQVPGSGYGTRSVTVDIFDDCSASNPSQVWNNAYGGISYATPAQAGRGVDLPHANITRYLYMRASQGTFSNCWVSNSFSATKNVTKVFACHLRRYDPQWTFSAGGEDNNTKYASLSATDSMAGGDPENGGYYWYHDQTKQKESLTDYWENSFYSSGLLGNLDTAWSGAQGGSGDSANDPWYGWVQFEYRFGIGPSGQILRFLTNNKFYQNRTNQNTDNRGGTTTTRWWGVGNYSRQRGATNNIFLADIVMVTGPDAWKRVILANHANYSQATITEFQPIISWNNTITCRCNKGRLPSGTAHCHVFDENDSPTYVGEIILA